MTSKDDSKKTPTIVVKSIKSERIHKRYSEDLVINSNKQERGKSSGKSPEIKTDKSDSDEK